MIHLNDIGCGKGAIYGWRQGVASSTTNLQRLLELGADVNFILSGKREGK